MEKTKTAKKEKEYDTVFKEYGGVKRWRVRHGGRVCIAAAPDEDSAMVAAAQLWGCRWQEYAFYAYCIVQKA